jgi:pyridoxal 5'-phosphate synthase pdxS subunit
MLKGGVIMDVINVEQAKIAEEAGAVAVMALERIPADIRADGGVSRMSDPDLIDAIKAAVSIPVSTKSLYSSNIPPNILSLTCLTSTSGDGQGPHWPLCRSSDSAELGD